MARPLRLEFAGAFHYARAGGDHRNPLFVDATDRASFLDVLGQVCERYAWRCHAYCLLPVRYELLVETERPTLARGMRQLNGVYAQRANRRRQAAGHVFGGRYRSLLVDPGRHLARVARHVALLPWRAGLTACPAAFEWSGCAATLGWRAAPRWLATDAVLAGFGATHEAATAGFASYVEQGMTAPEDARLAGARGALADTAYLERMAARHPELAAGGGCAAVPGPALGALVAGIADRREAMRRAYATGGFSLKQIAAHFGVHYATVSRAVGRSAR